MKKAIFLLFYFTNPVKALSQVKIPFRKKAPEAVVKDELTVYIIPPPFPLRYSSPAALAFSTLINVLACLFKKHKHPIGHVTVELKSSSDEVVVYTGAVMKSAIVSFLQVITKGMGMGVLWETFHGKEEPTKKIQREIKDRLKNGNIYFMKFEIDPSVSQKLVNYYNDYKEKELHKNYGAALDPLQDEGGGCSAYGVSFMRHTGMIDEEVYQSWFQHISVSERLIKSEKKVSFFTIFRHLHWAHEGEQTKDVKVYEPQKMMEWVLTQKQYPIEQMGNARGVVIS